MEKTKLEVIDNLMNAKTQKEAEATIIVAIRALEEHRVHKHLIVRFIMKLIDQIEQKNKTCLEAQTRLILDRSLLFLKQLNHS